MAEILGKDLDNWDDSLAAREPYSLSESSTTGAQFITGADLLRSAKISSEWRDPIAIYAQAYNPMSKAFQVSESALTATVDTVRNLPSNVANLGAQTFIELSEGERMLPDVSSALTAKSGEETLAKLRKALSQSQQSIDEAVFLLKDRDYPVSKFARRVIADTTANVENRKIVRELYNQAHGIDSSKWYNEAGSIIGAMLPAMAAGNIAFSGARAFGAGRLAAVNTAKNIVKGYIGAEMAGQYAEETAAEYLARTGDKNFENFTAKDASGMMAAAYGAIGAQIEFMGGVEPVFAGALTKVGLRSSALKAAAKIGVGEATEELLQGLTETLMRKIDGTSDKTWKEGFEESLKGAAWGLFIGGTLGTTAFYTNRRNLVKGIKVAVPGIEEAQAELIADAMIDTTGEISSQEPSLRNNLRQKVALMYEDADIENKEDRIDAITDLEYGLVAMDAAERGIDLAEHELFSGEVNELGWFRAGIPEARRVEIQEINDNIRDLKTQLKELNKAEQKDWAKIEEIENKLAQANQYVLEKLNDLARDDAAAVRRMLRGIEEKYVNREKEKATKQAIKSGSVDVIRTELQSAGFRTRDLSGTQIKELAKLNWELLQGKDLGIAQSRGTAQIPLAAIEQNVISGNEMLLRAGYTQDQIDSMDDETWNRAIQVQMRKEIPQVVEPEIPEDVLDQLEFQSEQFDTPDDRNLVVTHGISVDKLEKVLKLGGFPVPSIAISKIDEPLENFGAIKLVGTKEIINPELRSSNLVYDRDIWSKRLPRPEYKNAKIADIRKFRDKFEKYFIMADDASTLYGSITDVMANSRTPALAIEAFQNSKGAKLYYIENILGKKIEVPKYDRAQTLFNKLTLFVKPDEQFVKEIAEIDPDIYNTDKLRQQVEPLIRNLIDRFDFEKEYSQYANKMKTEAENYYFSEKFKGSDIAYLIRSAKDYLRMKKDDSMRYGVDNIELNSVLEKYKLYDNQNYMDWAEQQITDLLGEPRVKVGNKLLPWTVENITSAMIKGKTVGVESNAMSIGKIISAGAKRFSNIESIREEGKRLQPKKQSEEQTNQLGNDMYGLAEDIINAAQLSDNFSNVDMVLLSLQEGVSRKSITEDGFEKLLNKNLDIFAKYPRGLLKRGIDLIKQTKDIVRFYFEAKPQRVVSLNEFAGAVVPTDERYNEISAKLSDRGLYVVRTDNLQDGILNIENLSGNVLFQNRVSGAALSTYRGAYIPTYRFILRANRMDASTLSHELAHDWFETNFARYRSGKATKEFMRAWGALEKALGVPENATSTPRQASEAFARAYEAWIIQNEDWAKLVNVEDKDRDAVEKLMKDYQNDLRDIYNDISNPYFKQTWGKLGELKPELKAWFDRVVNITDLDVMVERGEMTAEEAGAEKLNRAIDTVIENTEDADTVKVLKEVRTLNDTQRYEAEGGNKNSLQMRLSALAREIDENNMLVKENYDTRRDMMAVAEAADNFVKTRLDDALAIINGQMAEVEGLYKEDLYTALERLAIENGDLGLIDELKNSEIANRLGKELGQRVAGFRNFKQSTDLDVVSALKSLDNSYNKALENKKAQKQFNEALAMLDKSLKTQDSIADKELDATLKELECK